MVCFSRKVFIVGIFSLSMLVCIGCGDQHRLKGKVTFADGQPVTSGMVIFSNASFQARGEIQSDGNYTVSSTGKNDGIPKGEYKVTVSGIVKLVGGGKNPMPFPVPLCDEKYMNVDTTDLSCTVPVSRNTFDIILEPHPTNYEGS